jgi:glycosyl transferase, family 25
MNAFFNRAASFLLLVVLLHLVFIIILTAIPTIFMQSTFDHINSYFDKAWVLTLPRLAGRMEAVKKRLEGLQFDFYFGTDKETIDLARAGQLGWYSQERYNQYYKRPPSMSKGMLSCSLGHRSMYETILRNGYQRTLVLEDDVLPIEQNLCLFSHIMDNVPADWDLLYFGYEKNENFGWKQRLKRMVYVTWPYHAKLKLNRQVYWNYYPRKLSAHIARAGFHDCTHAYAVTMEGARKLLQLQTPAAFNADNLLAFACATKLVKGYICKPKLFNQESAFVGSVHSLTGD